MASGNDGQLGEGSMLIAAIAALVSVACHFGGYVALSKVDFSSGTKVEWKSNRFQGSPPMRIQRFEGDPMAGTPERGGQVKPAPVEDADDAAHVDRLETSSDAPAATPLALSADAEAVKPVEVKPDLENDVWLPRQEIVAITAPTVNDPEAALPRKVIPEVDRVKVAEDIVPMADLIDAGRAAPAAAPLPLAPAGAGALPGVGGGKAEDRFGFAPPAPALPEPTFTVDIRPPERPGAGEGASGEAGASGADGEGVAGSPGDAAEKAKEDASAVSADVLSSVDELVVRDERNAVERLKDTLPTRPLEPEVTTGLQWWGDAGDGGKRYFRVTIEPAAASSLPVIPKDVLFLVDASGSVLNSFRPTCNGVSNMMRLLNEGDRFNIVFFRNVFKPVFSGWREATATSFSLADAALKRESAKGTTDVFASLKSILMMPRDPARPIITVVASDGKPEGQSVGVTRSADIISRFSELNGGMSSVYFYGISSSANAYLIDMIAARNRGDSVIQRGMFDSIADGLVKFNARYAAPVVSDLSVVFAASSKAETYPKLVTNLCRSQRVEIYGVCPADVQEVVFSVKGLAGTVAYESVFRLPFARGEQGRATLRAAWAKKKMHEMVSNYTIKPGKELMAEMRAFSARYGVEIPYLSALKEAQAR